MKHATIVMHLIVCSLLCNTKKMEGASPGLCITDKKKIKTRPLIKEFILTSFPLPDCILQRVHPSGFFRTDLALWSLGLYTNLGQIRLCTDRTNKVSK